MAERERRYMGYYDLEMWDICNKCGVDFRANHRKCPDCYPLATISYYKHDIKRNLLILWRFIRENYKKLTGCA